MERSTRGLVGRVGGYSSELEPDSDVEAKRRKRQDLADSGQKISTRANITFSVASTVRQPVAPSFVSTESRRLLASDILGREEAHLRRQNYLSLNAYDRHKMLINAYASYSKPRSQEQKRARSDLDVIREHHQFLWDESNDIEGDEDPNIAWERKLAHRYHDKLFKEYCIADLSRFRDGAIALRWRTESEVVTAKGQFLCGERSCKESVGLSSWEVNFGYVERSVKKQALVKVRLCPDCSSKLNFKHQHKSATQRLQSLSRQQEPQGTEITCIGMKQEVVEQEGPLSQQPSSSSSSDHWRQKSAEVAEVDDEVPQSVDHDIDEYLRDLFP